MDLDLPLADLAAEAARVTAEAIPLLRKRLKDTSDLLVDNSIWMGRTVGVGYLDLAGCMALGITGLILRSTGLPHDLRKSDPYCGYENYEFEVCTQDTSDAYGRFLIRLAEMEQSLDIVEQCLDRLQPGPVMVADKKIAWPSQLSIGSDGQGNSLEHIRHIMGESMEALIHHFKLFTEGFRIPPGETYSHIESPRGEIGCYLVSDGTGKPVRMHMRGPSFYNLQSMTPMMQGRLVADAVAIISTVDPIMGEVDR